MTQLYETEKQSAFVFVSLIAKVQTSPSRLSSRNVTVKQRVWRTKVGHSRLTLSFDPSFMKTRWAVHLNQYRHGGGVCSVLCESVNVEI